MTDMETAEAIADMIRRETRGLDHEESDEMRTYHPTYVRAKKYRDQERAKINGYRIALSYVLGCPRDMQKTDAFIAQVPHWEAL